MPGPPHPDPPRAAPAHRGLLHHVELWVPDLEAAQPRWDWLLGRLGHERERTWRGGASYRCGATYLVLEQSPALTADRHERTRPGVNHLAFHAGSREEVAALVVEGAARGWRLLFPERHPFAGGPGHWAAYLEDDDGFEVELVAS